MRLSALMFMKILMVMLSFAFISCGDTVNNQSRQSGDTNKIEIVSFKVNKQKVPVNGSVILSWEVKNAKKVSIEPDIDDNAPFKGEKEISGLTKTSTFTLTASDNAGNKKTAEVIVQVESGFGDNENPQIISFSASASKVSCGDTVTLEWETKGTKSVTIEPNDGCNETKANASCEVFPRKNTTYTIKAGTGDNEVTETVEISVSDGEAKILEFRAVPSEIEAGLSSSLEWKVACADKISIVRANSNEKIVDATDELDGSATVSPTETTQYTLQAEYLSNSITKSVEQSVEITVLPGIVFFTATPETVNDGEESVLSWKTIGASSITLTKQSGNETAEIIKEVLPGDIGNPEPAQFSVYPNKDTTYTLEARNVAGDTSKKQVTITVSPYPRIDIFSSDKTEILAGETIVFTWKVTGDVSAVSLVGPDFSGIDPGQYSGTVSAQPLQSGDFVLSAQGNAGTVSQKISIKVWQEVIITSFTADPKIVSGGQSSSLKWDIQNADSIQITDKGGTIIANSTSLKGSQSVTPSKSTTYTLTAKNGGGSQLSASTDVLVDPAQILSFQVSDDYILSGDTATITWSTSGGTGVNILGTGGDAQAPYTETYKWHDISTTGTEASMVDNSGSVDFDEGKAKNIPLGFSFEFYGNTYTTCNISTNGFISFDDFDFFNGYPKEFPFNKDPYFDPQYDLDPANMIAPFWDDLDESGSTTKVVYETIGNAPYRKFIVSWLHFGFWLNSADLVFQLVINEDGSLEYNYQTMSGYADSDGSGASIGIGNQDGTKGQSYLFKGAAPDGSVRTIASSTSIRFGSEILPVNGTLSVSPEETTTYTVRVLDPLGYNQEQTLTVHVIPSNSIIINEFLTDSASGDWIELYNRGNKTINLKDWKLGDDNGQSVTISAADLNIDANDYLLIALQQNIPNITADITLSGFSLDDSSGEIIIQAFGLAVDQVEYDSASWPVQNGKSTFLKRGADSYDNDNADHWCVSATLVGSSNTDHGTPSKVNETCAGATADVCSEIVTVSNFTADSNDLIYTASVNGSTKYSANDITYEEIGCAAVSTGNGPDAFYTFTVPQNVDFETLTITVTPLDNNNQPFNGTPSWKAHVALIPASCTFASDSGFCGQLDTNHSSVLELNGPFNAAEVWDIVVDSDDMNSSGNFKLQIQGEKLVSHSYAISAANISFVDISTNAKAVLETDEVSGILTGNDDYTQVFVNDNFSFEFFGKKQNKVIVDVNGFITFDASSWTNFTNTNIPDEGEPNSIIAAFWDDLSPKDQSCSSFTCPVVGKIYTLIQGTAPNRTYTIMYKKFNYDTLASNGGTGEYNFEIIMYEATGIIEIVYGIMDDFGTTTDNTNTANCELATIGLEGQDLDPNDPTILPPGVLYCFDGKDEAGGNISIDSIQALRFTPTIL